MSFRWNLMVSSALFISACSSTPRLDGVPTMSQNVSSNASPAPNAGSVPGTASSTSGAGPGTPAGPAPVLPTAPAANCGPATPRFSGALCGPSVRCALSVHEVVSTDSVFLAPGTTAITVDSANRPVIAYGTEGDDGAFHGHVAVRADSQPAVWSDESTPFALKTVALATSADGAVHALVFDGAQTVSHVARIGSNWSAPDLLAASGEGGGDRLQVDDAGCVRGAFTDSAAHEELATLDGDAWTIGALDGAMSRGGSPTLALAASGQPHLVAWVPDPTGSLMLAWSGSSGASEAVGPHQVAGAIPPRLGVTGEGAGQPHVLFVDPGDGARPARLEYATRTSDEWTVEVVEEDQHDSTCGTLPVSSTDTCTSVDVVHAPIAVLTSGSGDVRLLYSRHESVQEFGAQCDEGGCYWAPAAPTSIDSVKIGWPTVSGIDETDLIDGVNITTASAVLDSRGRIHVVATVDQHVHYLSIIPVS